MQDLATIIGLANLVVTLSGGAIFVLRLEGRLNVQAVQISNMDRRQDDASEMIKLLSSQSQRMALLESQVNDLRRGRGWIRGHKAEGVDGEYTS